MLIFMQMPAFIVYKHACVPISIAKVYIIYVRILFEGLRSRVKQSMEKCLNCPEIKNIYVPKTREIIESPVAFKTLRH